MKKTDHGGLCKIGLTDFVFADRFCIIPQVNTSLVNEDPKHYADHPHVETNNLIKIAKCQSRKYQQEDNIASKIRKKHFFPDRLDLQLGFGIQLLAGFQKG